MADQEKPLPKPPKKAFGFQKNEPEQGGQDLLADRMALAAAEGKLDEFLQKEMPGSEHAQALAKMMMGMTGMMSAGVPIAQREETPGESVTERRAMSMPPDEVLKAVQGGDVKGLMELLRQEHQRRSPGGRTSESETADPVTEALAQQPSGQPVIDKELIDAMIQIANDNSVTMDWIILRAVKIYVEEYRKTGKL